MRVLRQLLFVVTLGVGVGSFAFSAQAQSSDSQNRRVLVANLSGDIVVSFYASNVGRNSWEEDMLRARVLAPGDSVVFNIDDGSGYCMYDFKVVYLSGIVDILPSRNVCELARLVIRER